MSLNDNSSNSSSGVGNTIPPHKQVSPSKRWSFTIFNVDETNINNIIEIINSSNSSYILGDEICPDTQKRHLQGYVEFTSKCRPKNLFLDKTIHWEKSKGNRNANINYCMKEKLFSTNFHIPKPIKVLNYNELYKWELIILDIIKEPTNVRSIYWFRGDGMDGKTTFCKYLCIKEKAIILGGKCADMKNGLLDFYKKNNYLPELILINIPKSFDEQYISYTGIEEIKDMLFYSGKYEGGMICGNSPHLFVFSNEWPNITKCSKDRWELFDINMEKYIPIEEFISEH